MPSACAAYNCSNRSSKTFGISYYRFPLRNKDLTQRWVVNMRREEWYPTRFTYICSAHFEDRYTYIVNGKKRLLAQAIPTIFSFQDHRKKPIPVIGKHQRKRPIVKESASFNVNVSSNELVVMEDHIVQMDHSYCLPRPQEINDYGIEMKELVKEAKQIKQGLYKKLKDSESDVLRK